MHPFLNYSAALVVALTGCHQPPEKTASHLSPDSLKASVIRANHEMMNLGNVDFADQVFDPSYANGSGPEMMKSFIEGLRSTFPDLEVNIDPVIVEGNIVAWQRTNTATHQHEIMGFPPTGKKITWKMMSFSRYNEEGLVVEDIYLNNLYEVLHRNSQQAATENQSVE